MLITFVCPHCENKLLAGEHSTGKEITCQCGWPVTVPKVVADSSPLPSYLQEQQVFPAVVVTPPAATKPEKKSALLIPLAPDEEREDMHEIAHCLPAGAQGQPALRALRSSSPTESSILPVEEPPPGPKLTRPADEGSKPAREPRRKGRKSRRNWPGWLMAATAIVGGFLVGLGLVLFRGTRSSETKSVPEDVSAEQVAAAPGPGETRTETNRQVLERGLKLTGTVTAGTHKEPLEGNTAWTCLRWQLDLSLVNETPWPLELGTDFFLFEASADLSLFEGVVLFRGLAARPTERGHLMPVALGDPYGLPNNVQAHFASGAYFLRRGNRSLRDNGLEYLEDGRVLVHRAGRPRFSPGDEDPRTGFGQVQPQQTRSFKLFLDQGVYFPDASLRARVQIVLPELSVASGKEPERYRLVLHLQKAPLNPQSWQIVGRDLLRVEPGELARLVETAGTNPITRLCAANWLDESDPDHGRETLVRVGRSLQEGPLLLTCLQLLTARKGTGLEDHALRVLQDARAAAGMRGWAALYLGVLRHQPAYSALVKTAGDSGDLASLGAIHALGAYGPAAAKALLDLLSAVPAGQNSLAGSVVADNLVLTGARTPTIASTLWQLVEKDNRPALQALVKSAYPETFPNLRKRARTEQRPEWKGVLAGALLEVDADRAVPEVLEMLRRDEPPPENKVLLQNDLVRVLQGWYSTQALVGLLELTREGNLRAVQVLAGMPQDAALAALIGIVRSGTETQVFIALDGLAQRWPRQSVRVFRDALKHPNKFIVMKAIEELSLSGDPMVASWLTPFRGNKDQDLRAAAERALEKVTGGKAAP